MAIWEKLFRKIIFKDYPDTSTPLNASNMNALSDAIDGIDDRVVELNSNLEKWNIPSKNIIIQSDTDHTDVTNISTTNPSADINKPCRVHQVSSGSAVKGMPSVFPQGVGFVGIRYVEYFNPQNITIRLEEIAPVLGRVWTRAWNGSAWGKWVNGNEGKTHATNGAMRTLIPYNTTITFSNGVGTHNVSDYLATIGLENVSGVGFAMLRSGSASSTYAVKKCVVNNTTKEITIVASNDDGTLLNGNADVSILITAY